MISNNRHQTAVSFSKYSGCGNDFILIDNRQSIFPKSNKNLIKSLCRRSLGIGADGLVFLEESQKADYRMSIFNADGSEAEMCGNGLRCLALYLKEQKILKNPFTVEVSGKNYFISTQKNRVSVAMPPPCSPEWDIPMEYNKKNFIIDYIDTGVPHIILFVEDIEKIDMEEMAPYLRHHPRFNPKGANVNFASLSGQNTLFIRTYERGVEGETLACGTGAAAVAVAAERKYNLLAPITLITRSLEKLQFEIVKKDQQIESLIMQGSARKIYSGLFEIEKLLNPE